MSDLSEFRQDLVSGDWVLFSTGRRHSVREFEDSYQPKEDCPFEDPKKSGQEIVWGWPDNENWQAMVIKNKYPAVKGGLCGPDYQAGPFNLHDAVGDHDVVIFKDHDLLFADFSNEQMVEAIRVYKKRYREVAKASDCTEYVMIFHNFGKEAGASIYHPHSQIISVPVLPPDVSRSIHGSYRFYKANGKRVYDVIINRELEEKKRIVYENDMFIAFCPYVSKTPYEVRIFARDSHAHFEEMPDEFDKHLADALTAVLKKINKALGSPPFNFFIHTAPVHPVKSAEGGASKRQFNGVKENQLKNFHEFYSWHVEILPKIKIAAGFELGTGVDINVVDPDEAAEKLRNA